MTQLSFKVVNAGKIKTAFHNLGAKLPKVASSRLKKFIERLKKRMKIYPAQRSGQKYVRTYTLRDKWKVAMVGPLKYTLKNTTHYTKWVVGTAYGTMQAWMHEGRWTTLRDAADDEMKSLPENYAKDIKVVARREGLRVK